MGVQTCARPISRKPSAAIAAAGPNRIQLVSASEKKPWINTSGRAPPVSGPTSHHTSRGPSKLSKNRVSVGEFANGLHPAIDERLVLVGAISGQVACVEPCLMPALGAEMMLGREPRRTVEAADRQIHILTALLEREAQRRTARRAEWALCERR